MSDATKSLEPSRAASRERLQELHAALLEVILAKFKSGKPLSVNFLGVVRRFLKDNGVVINAAAAKDLRQSLEELRSLSLPFTTKDTKQ